MVSTVTKKACKKAVDKIAELKERYKRIRVADRSSVFNTDVLYTVELGYILDVAQSIANSAIERKESRGAHQRLDYTERDDVNYLKHTLAYYNGDDAPRIEYSPVKSLNLNQQNVFMVLKQKRQKRLRKLRSKQMANSPVMTVEVLSYNPENDQEPHLSSYQVPYDNQLLF